ncbi:MAG: 2-C-methyl-D-erythritol 2,4-cyclodiphosphate synthase [Evtepia sp.]
MRIGHGYDVHRLTSNRKLILGGVEIPFPQGLLGHSDADVLTHAVMDALLGAAALGDIGQQFPDRDPAYAGISSLILLGKVAKLLREGAWKIENIDATIVAEQPKLAHFIPEMRRNLAKYLGIRWDCVSVKATTEEGLGLAGKGIAAHAVALITEQTQVVRL